MAAYIRITYGSLFRNFVQRSPNTFLSQNRESRYVVARRPGLYYRPHSTGQRNSCSAAITRTARAIYSRTYKVRLVQPDGSTFVIRYEEPYKIVKQPIDPATMSEEEKKSRMKRLKPEKPKKIYELEEEEDEGYNQRSWANLIKKH